MYLVLGGGAATQRKAPNGEAVTLKTVRVGDVIAESSLTSPRYESDWLCLINGRLLQLPVGALRRAIDEDADTRW